MLDGPLEIDNDPSANLHVDQHLGNVALLLLCLGQLQIAPDNICSWLRLYLVSTPLMPS